MPSKVAPSDLSAHLGYWLRFVSNHVSNAFARKLESHDVTVAEWVMLRQLLDAEPFSSSKLADRMGATRGTVTKLADRLIAKGFVVRTADVSDRRVQFLRLTPAGRALVPKLAHLADRNDAEFFDHLSQADREALLRTLHDIVDRRGLSSLPVD